jgi:transposase-like protein
VPQDRQGRFSTEPIERYQRSEKALVAALAEMYAQGVSTRQLKQVAEELGRRWVLGVCDRCDQQAAGCVVEGVL